MINCGNLYTNSSNIPCSNFIIFEQDYLGRLILVEVVRLELRMKQKDNNIKKKTNNHKKRSMN